MSKFSWILNFLNLPILKSKKTETLNMLILGTMIVWLQLDKKWDKNAPPGVNIISILQAAFTHAHPKSAKHTVKLLVFFELSDLWVLKLRVKHWWNLHLDYLWMKHNWAFFKKYNSPHPPSQHNKSCEKTHFAMISARITTSTLHPT